MDTAALGGATPRLNHETLFSKHLPASEPDAEVTMSAKTPVDADDVLNQVRTATQDLVSLQGAPQRGAGQSGRALYQFLGGLMPAAFSQGQGAQNASENAQGLGLLAQAQSVSAFSFKATFSSLRMRQQETGSLDSLMGKLQSQHDALDEMDPEQAGRLRMLMAALAFLDPDKADELLERVSKNLEGLQKIRDAQATGQQAIEQAAQTQQTAKQTPAQQQGGQTTEIVHFTLDFEVSMRQDVSQVVAELNDQGIHVQASQITATQTFKLHIEFTGVRQQKNADPLVLDLEGNGVDLTSVNDGEDFDITGDGKKERTAFVQGDDAFLALDRNGNGRIDGGKELFGDQHGAKNGFAELARFDDNRDRVIDHQDAIFHSLRLLHDQDGDGRVSATELSTLSEKGITSLDLGYSEVPWQKDEHGNILAERSRYKGPEGRQGDLLDVWVGYRD